MRELTTALGDHMAQDVTTLATCWRIRRRDGVLMGFTTHDTGIIVDQLEYMPSSAFSPSNISSSNAMNVDNLDVQGALSGAAVTSEDLASGRYDFSEVEIFMVDWSMPDAGKLLLRKGWIGEVKIRDGQFVAEVRGLMQSLQQTVGEVYSAECRADLGDARCRVDLSLVSVAGKVTAAIDQGSFVDTGRTEGNGWFEYGLLRWQTGNNAGQAMEVRRFSEQTFTLFEAMPKPVSVGDIYSVYAGCDKRSATCKTKFGNILNFRGEPFVPGTDSVLRYPGLK